MLSDSIKITQAIQFARLGDWARSVPLFREVWEADKSNQDIFYDYIRCLYQVNLDDQILAAIDEMGSGVSSPLNERILRLGLNAAIRCNHHESQKRILLELYRIHPYDPEICVQLSAFLMGQQDFDNAELVLRKALSRFPADPELLTNEAILFSEKGNYQGAEGCYAKVVQIAPRQFVGHYNLAMFLILMGRHIEAKSHLEKCLQIVPAAPEAIAALRLIDERDESSGVLGVFYQQVDRQHWDEARLSLLAVKSEIPLFKYLAAASELRPSDYEILELHPFLDSSKVIYTGRILEPEEPLVSELILSVQSHPTLVLNRAGKPTVSGFQTHEILDYCNKPPIIELKQRILKACDEYLQTKHFNPWLDQLTSGSARKVSGWGVVLCDRGHQKRHVHPESIISGVVYLKTPESTSSHETSEGNLVFSRWENFEVVPDVGKIVLFPSYLPHKTVEIVGSEERICIAFNVS